MDANVLNVGVCSDQPSMFDAVMVLGSRDVISFNKPGDKVEVVQQSTYALTVRSRYQNNIRLALNHSEWYYPYAMCVRTFRILPSMRITVSLYNEYHNKL